MLLFTRRSFTKHILLLLLVPTLIIGFSSMKEGDGNGLALGAKLPHITKKMKNVDGSEITLADLMMDSGLIVVFSCNTCPFVVGGEKFEGWEKQYNDLYELATSNNVGFVLINSNEAKRDGDDSFEAMVSHAENEHYKMKYLVDVNSEIANAFGAKTTPHVFAFNGKAKLVYKGSIDNSWDSKRTELNKYLTNVVDHLANGLTLKEATSPPRGCSIKRSK